MDVLASEYSPLSYERFLFGAIIASLGIFVYRRYIEGGQFKRDHVKMDGKVVIITGANTGIGKETAMDLARRNARIYLACRDFDRCEVARKEIMEKTGNQQIFNRHLDLSNQISVRDFVVKFSKDEKKLDVLINNAGVFYLPQSLTVDEIESHLGINHVSHFLLTHLLLDHLKKAPQGRIVNVSSMAYTNANIDKDDLHLQTSYDKSRAYGNSKLAQILTTQQLARELEGTNITTYSLHPGFIRTEGQRYLPWFIRTFIFPILLFLFAKSTKSGAQTTIRCAVDPDLTTISGKYFSDCEVAEIKHPYARDKEMNDFIWKESLRLANISPKFSYS